ncbi:MAG: YeeE/YedE family protein [Gammaproteobacteria bacterium]|nr:YeeE/YedE family protein [Gammaproteobacteria bacterium]
MVYQSFAQAQSFFLWSVFGIAVVMGALVNKTNFCTMGAVSDWVNMGDTGRLRSWMFAIAVAMLGVTILEASGLINLTSTFPPYRASQLVWAQNLLGGLMFGVGMTLASGCGNKALIRIGGGNLKSVMVVAIIGLIAYFMANPLPGTDQTLYTILFYDWISPLSVTLKTSQDLGAIVVGSGTPANARLAVGIILGLALLAYVFISADFRGSLDNILGGLVVGLAVIAVWYITSNVMVSADGQNFPLQNFVAEQWDMYAAPGDLKPADSRPLSVQSLTFINPMGQTVGYAIDGFKATALNIGVMVLTGVILGSLLWSLISRSFRIEWFASVKDFVNHFVGAILMGFGGVLAMGCTIGQGVTGVSTLAVGSIITLIAIIAGTAATMKYQYWRMMNEA